MKKEITINGEKYRKVEEIKKFYPREFYIDIRAYCDDSPTEMYNYILDSMPPIKIRKDNNYEYKLFLKSKEVNNYVNRMVEELKFEFLERPEKIRYIRENIGFLNNERMKRYIEKHKKNYKYLVEGYKEYKINA